MPRRRRAPSLAAACRAVKLPLNLSGAITTRIALGPILMPGQELRARKSQKKNHHAERDDYTGPGKKIPEASTALIEA